MSKSKLNDLFCPKNHLRYAARMTMIKQKIDPIAPKKIFRGEKDGVPFFVISSSLQEARLLCVFSHLNFCSGATDEFLERILSYSDQNQIDLIKDMIGFVEGNFIWEIEWFGDENSKKPLSFPFAIDKVTACKAAGILYPSREAIATITCLPQHIYEDAVTGDITTGKGEITITAPAGAWATLPYQIIDLLRVGELYEFIAFNKTRGEIE